MKDKPIKIDLEFQRMRNELLDELKKCNDKESLVKYLISIHFLVQSSLDEMESLEKQRNGGDPAHITNQKCYGKPSYV